MDLDIEGYELTVPLSKDEVWEFVFNPDTPLVIGMVPIIGNEAMWRYMTTGTMEGNTDGRESDERA